ncbi:uncharacterized protein LOC144437475 [Glandiceps talaboti]
MDPRESKIIDKNGAYLRKNINADSVITVTKKLFPEIIKRADEEELKLTHGEAKCGIILNIFKGRKDGFNKLIEVLNKTGHPSVMLRLFDVGETTDHQRHQALENYAPAGYTGTSTPSKLQSEAGKKRRDVSRDRPVAVPNSARGKTFNKGASASTEKKQEDNEYIPKDDVVDMFKQLMESHSRVGRDVQNLNRELSNVKAEMLLKMQQLTCDFTSLKTTTTTLIKATQDNIAKLDKEILKQQADTKEIHKILEAISADVQVLKEKYENISDRIGQIEERKAEDMRNKDLLHDFLTKLNSLMLTPEKGEIRQLREDLNALSEWTKGNYSDLEKRIKRVEQDTDAEERCDLELGNGNEAMKHPIEESVASRNTPTQ